MATNIEIKARVKAFEALQDRVEMISDTEVVLIPQEDIYFHANSGRLKLRVLSDERGELISYQRTDQARPKASEYFISITNEPEQLRQVLEASLGVRGIVRKRRWLYWLGNTRVHLDEVEGLGSFVELEVVLSLGQSIKDGQATATYLMDRLEIDTADLIEGSYIDLLLSEDNGPGQIT